MTSFEIRWATRDAELSFRGAVLGRVSLRVQLRDMLDAQWFGRSARDAKQFFG